MVMAGGKKIEDKKTKQEDLGWDLKSWNKKFSQNTMQRERKIKLWKIATRYGGSILEIYSRQNGHFRGR